MKLEEPLWDSKLVKRSKEEYPIFLSAIYEHLETNIPRELMGYSDAFWPEDAQLFPRHETVQKYLEDYGRDMLPMIRFTTQVQDVRLNSNNTWSVTIRDLRTQQTSTLTYDAVIVATGHYNTPYIPSISGLSKWDALLPGTISHSKYYRVPEAYSGKKIIVIGNGPSGLDISSQIAPHCSSLLLSSKSANPMSAAFHSSPKIQQVPEIASLNAQTQTATFANGRTEAAIDALLFCTGYLYTHPFLSGLSPPPITTGLRVEHTYLHLFYAPRPTLAFLALQQKIIPFPLAEAQASVLARVCAGRLALPAYADMAEWLRRAERDGDDGVKFHVLGYPKDAAYINMLVGWAGEAEEREGLENGGKGKVARGWGPRECWMRERFAGIRRAFVERGEGRKGVRTVEELGFWFEDGEGRSGDRERDGMEDDGVEVGNGVL